MKKLIILTISLVLLAPFAFSYDLGDESEPSTIEPRYYDDAKVLRVKYTQGEAYVKRSYDEGFEEAALNLPIFEKDIAGTTEGRLEVYLGRLNYVRLDFDTEVVFDKVPALRKTDLNLRVIRGGVYLDIENLDYERDIEIQTPDCGIFVLERGLYRINVSEGGRTEVYVYDGIAEVAGDNYSRNVRENQKIVMFNGQVKERPFYFYSTDTDEFDRWNRDRNNIVGYARYSSSRYLDDGYEEYEYELSRHGRWRYHSTYNNYIWIPYSVHADWRPYYHGRWIWHPFYGHTWMSFDSWGFFTHHYGRWHWDPIYHWHWIPGYHWSPAWVSWFWDDYYYGWCPL
ncbi:MAG: FecR domain-containing protein, partial [Candidatus Aminicenantes bacterium]